MLSSAPIAPCSAIQNSAAASSTFGPWLYRIVLNVVRNRVRRADALAGRHRRPCRRRARCRRPRCSPRSSRCTPKPRDRLARAIVDLPPRYATAVVLRHVQGLSYAEAAEILDQPVGTTKSDVHRGVRLLRDALEPELLAEVRTY